MNLGPTECIIILTIMGIAAAVVIGFVLLFSTLWRHDKRQCPYCKSYIPKDASVCRYCRREVTPEV